MDEDVSIIQYMNYEYICTMTVEESTYGAEEQFYLYITTKIEKQPIDHDMDIETVIEPKEIELPVFDILTTEDPHVMSDISLINIQTELYQQEFSHLMDILINVEYKNKSLDIDSHIMVWEEMKPVDALDIMLKIELQQKNQILFPIELSTYPHALNHYMDISTHYSGVDMEYPLFNTLVSYEERTMDVNIPINVLLPSRLNRLDILSTMKVPKWDYIYSIFSNMEVVRGVHKSILCFLEIESHFVQHEIESSMILESELVNKDLFNIECVMYPTMYTDILADMEIEGVCTRRDIDCWMCTVLGIEKDIDASLDIMGEFQQEWFSQMSVINESVKLEDIGRIGIFVDPLWRYEPWVLKNSIGTILNRAVYQNHQKFTLVYGGSPRANFDICKYSTIYNIPHKEVPYSYMPTNVSFNVDQMTRFTRELFSFTNREVSLISKVFIFTDNPYTRTCTYLNPLIKACDLYKIPIVMITSKGDISGTDPANPLLYQSTHKVDATYPLEHQPHFAYGSGSKHIELHDDKSIV